MPLLALSPQLNSTCSLKSSYFPSLINSGPFPGVISSPFSTFQTFSAFGSLMCQPVRSFLLNSSTGFPHFGGFVRTNAGARSPVHCHVLASGPFTVPERVFPFNVPSKIMSACAPSSSFGETKVSFPLESSAFGSARALPHRPTNCATRWLPSCLSSSQEGYSWVPSFSVRSQRPRNVFADSAAGAATTFSNPALRACAHAPTDNITTAKAKPPCRIFMIRRSFCRQHSLRKKEFPQQFLWIVSPPSTLVHWRCCLPRNQLGRHRKFLRIILESLHALQQNPRRRFSHVVQRLANGRQPRSVIRRHLNVVKPNYRHIFRHAQIGVAQRANRANRRNVIE